MKFKVLLTRVLQKEGLKELEKIADLILPEKKNYFLRLRKY